MVISSFVRWHRSSESPPHFINAALTLTLLVTLAACGGESPFEPSRAATQPVLAHPAVVVTANYSTYDTRSEFNGAGTIDHLNGFEEFTGEMLYPQPSPWTTNGVTYTSALNIVLGPGIGLGVSSNSVATEFGAQLTGSFDATDAFNLFGADLTVLGTKTPVGLTVFTNLTSYAFNNLDIPLATTGRQFLGISLANTGEYLTGFQFTVGSSGAAILLDNVAVGHVSIKTNAEPEASVGGPYSGNEGSAVSLALSATDADGDALTYSWDLGDGTKGSGAPPASHVYADNGSYDIMLAVDDGRGGVDTARTTATIANVAPTLAPFSLSSSPLALTPGGITIPVSSTFTDPGTLDTHTATLDCGNGVTTQASAPNGTAGGSCTFTSAGVYSVRLTVRDDDGDSDTEVASGQVLIYDPSGGFITGGGWVASPTSAYSVAMDLSGKLSFELSSKYQPGSTKPTGSVDLKLNTGKFEFHSTSLDMMLISANSFARLQGRGTLNGNGDYSFVLVAADNGADAIRVRICDRNGKLIYDTRPGEPLEALSTLGGGSIQMHGAETVTISSSPRGKGH